MTVRPCYATAPSIQCHVCRVDAGSVKASAMHYLCIGISKMQCWASFIPDSLHPDRALLIQFVSCRRADKKISYPSQMDFHIHPSLHVMCARAFAFIEIKVLSYKRWCVEPGPSLWQMAQYSHFVVYLDFDLLAPQLPPFCTGGKWSHAGVYKRPEADLPSGHITEGSGDWSEDLGVERPGRAEIPFQMSTQMCW